MTASDPHEEMRDKEIATQAKRFVSAIRTNLLTGNAAALHDMGNSLGEYLSLPGVSESLIRSALSCGPLTAGQMLLAAIENLIADDAEVEAIKEVERMEAAYTESVSEQRIEQYAGVREWYRAA